MTEREILILANQLGCLLELHGLGRGWTLTIGDRQYTALTVVDFEYLLLAEQKRQNEQRRQR